MSFFGVLFFFLREHLWNLQEVSANQWLAWPITGSLAAGRMVTMTTPNICYTVITAQFFSPFFGISGSSRLERYEETECLSKQKTLVCRVTMSVHTRSDAFACLAFAGYFSIPAFFHMELLFNLYSLG